MNSNRENGVKFGNYHSWLDWRLILTSADIGLPEPKVVSVDIPAADGSLDLTETVAGKVVYNNRTLTFEFSTTEQLSGIEWENLLSEIANAIHGQRIDITLDDDPNWTYSGRCTINSFTTNRRLSQIEIVCDCAPYKTDSAGNKSL